MCGSLQVCGLRGAAGMGSRVLCCVREVRSCAGPGVCAGPDLRARHGRRVDLEMIPQGAETAYLLGCTGLVVFSSANSWLRMLCDAKSSRQKGRSVLQWCYMPKKFMLRVRMDEDEERILRAIAQRKGLTLSDAVRRLVKLQAKKVSK